MALPDWFRELPPWATVLTILVGALVGLTALSMLLGVVFAGVAVAVELGSVAAGAAAAFVGLAVLIVPIVLAYVLLSNGSEDESTLDGGKSRPADESDDPIEVLRQRYLAGEIDEETFERQLERLVDPGRRAREADRTTDEKIDELEMEIDERPRSRERERERQ